ncbi:hypothetical protein U9M48_038740 [Paspalum notatum var. saurae]|uniref:Zinc finger GRF-type domain-containing protein n=1 Tax=Paspalum notatum var. saurae TaxID=547442 RepID=A0AAQ3UNT5_PASNO
MSAMSARSDHWGAASSSSQAGPVLVGEETGLPLIQCTDCKRERVVENMVKTREKVNYGRVYIKCPRNIPGMLGRCPFYRWQKAYLAELVEKQLIVIHPAVLEVEDDAPRNDAGAAIVERNSLDEKVDKLIRILQLLVVMIVAMFAVGVMYVFK